MQLNLKKFLHFIFIILRYEANASWIKEVIAGLESDIVLLHQNPEHGPILLIWMLLNFRIIELNEDDPKFRKYRQFGSKAVALGVYEFLRTMLSHPLYRDQSLTSSLTARSIYNQLSFLCDLFDSDGAIAQHKGIYELLSELLKIPIVAKEFCFNEGTAHYTDYLLILCFFNTFLFYRKWRTISTQYGYGKFSI